MLVYLENQETTKRPENKSPRSRQRSGTDLVPLVGACLARQATGSLRQEAVVSQKLLYDPLAVLLDLRACNHGLKRPQKPKTYCDNSREAPVRFGSVTVWRWNGSSGSGFRFRQFLCKKVFFSVFQYTLTGKDGSGSGFGSWKTVPAVAVPLSVSGKTVPTVPVSGSGSVPEPPCNSSFAILVFSLFLLFGRDPCGDHVSRRALRQHWPTMLVPLSASAKDLQNTGVSQALQARSVPPGVPLRVPKQRVTP